MTADHLQPSVERRVAPTQVLLFALGVLVLRMLASNVGRMSEGDEISIAASIVSIVRDVPGDAYRYPVQFGYYRLVATLVSVFGGDPSRVPIVMSWLSILAGVVIPVAGLLSFRHLLSAGERWMVGLALVANPIVWMSSRYGNTAMTSVALTVSAIAILSNRPKRGTEVLALALFGCAVMVRADAFLVSGAILALLWQNHRGVVRTFAPLAITGAIVLGVVLVLRLADPRMESVAAAVGSHVGAPIKTRFFDFLLWAMSPLPLLFAAVGLRELHRERRALFVALLAWCVPPMLFYFSTVTTPRYHLQAAIPLVLASAVGMLSFVDGSGLRRRLAWVAVAGLGFVHLLIGLSYFSPSERRSYLKDATIPSDDGPVWTGALLYKSFVQRRVEPARLLTSHFRASNGAELTYAHAFDSLASGARRGRRVVIANGGGYSSTMHLFANMAGVLVTNRKPGLDFDRETEMKLGGATVISIGTSPLRKTTVQLPLRVGDELWVVDKDSASAMREIEGHLPPEVVLVPQPAWPSAPRMLRFIARQRPQ